MDDPTRTAIEGRIAELQAQRTRLVMNVAAIDGAVGELRRWVTPTAASGLKEAEPTPAGARVSTCECGCNSAVVYEEP